jgi:hypothetical protein
MVLGAYRQVVGWCDDLKTLTADEPAVAKAMAGKLPMDADKDKNKPRMGPAPPSLRRGRLRMNAKRSCRLMDEKKKATILNPLRFLLEHSRDLRT